MTTAYWWKGDNRTGLVANLGDVLTPLLLSHFSNVDVTWATPDEADIIACGSVLDVLPRSGWHGTVIGAGQLHSETLTDLSFANVLALRGELTRQRVHYGNQTPVIGDPGLLASELVTPTPNLYEIGVCAHWSDKTLFPRELANARKYGYAEPLEIDITRDPLETIHIIGSCRKIVASALHGIITADAFGIPRRAEKFPAMSSDAVHEGGTFKWDDYASSLGMDMVFGQLQQAPRARVDQIQYDLFETFKTLGTMYG